MTATRRALWWVPGPRKLRGALKDARRRRALRHAGIGVELKIDYALYGARTGVWPLALGELGARPLLYSFGIGDNAAWEEAVIERHGAVVHGFDPTPVSVVWVEERTWPDGFHFHPVGLGAVNGDIVFDPPRKGANFTPRSEPTGEVTGRGAKGVRAPVRTLRRHLHELGHDRLDVLKMDIEGGEYGVFAEALPFPVQVHQVLVEFHHGWGRRARHEFTETLAALHALRAQGYRIYWISPRGLEFALIKSAEG